MKAKWIHDCNYCKYKGSMFHGSDKLDWYTCNDTVVARRGDDGPDYWSMPISMVTNDDYLVAGEFNTEFNGVNDMIVLARFMLSRE